MNIKCPKCGYKAQKNDYLCPTCNVKFRPKPVMMISAVLLLFGILNVSIPLIVFSIGLFMMKQWARRWLIIGIFMQILIFLFVTGLDYRAILDPINAASLGITLFIFVPMAIYLLKNEEVIEAFEFYGGRL